MGSVSMRFGTAARLGDTGASLAAQEELIHHRNILRIGRLVPLGRRASEFPVAGLLMHVLGLSPGFGCNGVTRSGQC